MKGENESMRAKKRFVADEQLLAEMPFGEKETLVMLLEHGHIDLDRVEKELAEEFPGIYNDVFPVMQDLSFAMSCNEHLDALHRVKLVSFETLEGDVRRWRLTDTARTLCEQNPDMVDRSRDAARRSWIRLVEVAPQGTRSKPTAGSGDDCCRLET